MGPGSEKPDPSGHKIDKGHQGVPITAKGATLPSSSWYFQRVEVGRAPEREAGGLPPYCVPGQFCVSLEP